MFPINWISSMSLQVQQALFPLHINSLYIKDSTIIMSIADKSEQQLCDIHLTSTESYIINKYGNICGQLRTAQNLYTWLYDIIKTTVYGFLEVKSDALVLSSNVITCVFFSGYIGLNINGKYIGASATLNFQRNIETVTKGRDLQLNVYGDYTYTYQSQKKIQYVNGVDMRGKDLIIQHSALSDLRVVTQADKITFIGVTDAS